MQTLHEVKYLHKTVGDFGQKITLPNKQGTLVYVQPETKKVLKAISDSFKYLNVTPTITLTMGLAVKHPKDQFSRAEGRKTALDNLAVYEFDIDYSNYEHFPAIKIKLKTELKRFNLHVYAKIYKDSGKLRIYDIEIWEK